MFENSKAFSGFSVDDNSVAKAFYGETLARPTTREFFVRAAPHCLVH